MTTNKDYQPPQFEQIKMALKGAQNALKEIGNHWDPNGDEVDRVAADVSSLEFALRDLITAVAESLSFLEELWTMSRGAHGQRASILQRLEHLEWQVKTISK